MPDRLPGLIRLAELPDATYRDECHFPPSRTPNLLLTAVCRAGSMAKQLGAARLGAETPRRSVQEALQPPSSDTEVVVPC
ncbi:MAG: hypothetical protein QOK07_2743 [Gemmatimonadaceae bacterium]|nr:hypothetical protein [Gemmatimonadaceae bacterium]